MITILGIAACILVFLIIFQISRAGELLSIIKGDDEAELSNEANNLAAIFWMGFLIFGLIAAVWSGVAYYPYFLPEAASEHGIVTDNLFNLTFYITGFVFVLTHILLCGFAFQYRGKKGATAYFFAHSNKLELIWTAIPSIVLTILIVFGLKAWYKMTGPEPDDSIVIEATGQQFNWIIRYAGMDNILGKREFEEMSAENTLGMIWSDENSKDDFFVTEIHIPVNKPVIFKLRSKDVLHSFYLPHFRVKQDCVPGIPTRFWMKANKTTAKMREITGNEKFNYELACAELCGSAHWNMRMVLVVDEEEDYNEWLAQQEPAYNTLKAGAEKTKSTEGEEISKNEEEQANVLAASF